MKAVLSLAFVLVCACGFSQEIRRPTTDVDIGQVVGPYGCSGVNVASSSMPKSWDLAGLSTSSSQSATGDLSSSYNQTRQFKSWQTTTQVYTGLTLNIYSSSDGWGAGGGGGTSSGQAKLSYSLDSGVTWALVLSDNSTGDGWVPQASTFTLPANQLLSKIRVNICVEGSKGTIVHGGGQAPGTDDIIIWDIWTVGSTGAPVTGNGSSTGMAVRSIIAVN